MDVFALALQRADALLLIFARATGLLTTAPAFSNRFVPVPVRVALALVLSLLVLPLVQGPQVPGGLPALALWVAQEMLVGMLLGLVAALAFAAVQFAAELLDLDLGFSVANLLDPLTQDPTPLVGNLQFLLALVFYLTVDGHHGLLLALLDSYALLPPGRAALTPGLERHVVDLAGALFRDGLALASPVLAALFLTTVALGVVSRAVPQMNLFAVGLPARAAAGLALLAALVPAYAAAFRSLFAGLYAHLYQALDAMR